MTPRVPYPKEFLKLRLLCILVEGLKERKKIYGREKRGVEIIYLRLPLTILYTTALYKYFYFTPVFWEIMALTRSSQPLSTRKSIED